jgi:hypothetical protein
VLDDPQGLAELRRLGARSVPVVSQGERFVFAQVLKDVVEFLGLAENTGPQLSPSELFVRDLHVLETAARLVRQMPEARLETMLPHRPRSWRQLMHHIFQIPTAFLDMEEGGGALTYESLVVPPPPAMTGVEIADFGDRVRRRLGVWWQRARDEDFAHPIRVYFGETSRHEMFERTVWHSAQHTRQLASLLEQAGIAPDRPLGRADIAGLPLTDKIWDEG